MRALAFTVLMLATPVLAQTPPSAPADPRIQTLPYDPGQVYRLNAATRYQVTVLFGTNETVENVAVGDSDAWQVTLNGRGNALFLQPVRATSPTNMTVITDRRVYSFELVPTFGPTPDTPFSLRFSYPEVQPRIGPSSPGETAPYRMSGNRALQPLAVIDDGTRTYIDWRPDQTLPAVFGVEGRGSEVLLEGYVRDGRYVIDAVHPTLVFRLDRLSARATRPRQRQRVSQ
ncbi:TrbG/VirB9 family P-type conjugative transfer protein [Brevundimonas subvibrioides]|uniref:TrbG/VirB9 family P-type conjugative transfer protein n=1 Tax=Brevundimonas subvibrioides TaxID=74313 RepID=UPI0022B4595F|nr:TrbG/VirB9 family P-type conjugative transfer protein [Brevundimonas subvibrioides]